MALHIYTNCTMLDYFQLLISIDCLLISFISNELFSMDYFQWLLFAGLFPMDYFQWIVSYGLFPMGCFLWIISNGLFPMNYFQWIISNGFYLLDHFQWIIFNGVYLLDPIFGSGTHLLRVQWTDIVVCLGNIILK